jgi:uncharacterized protein YlxP (DUF503 family)
MPAVGVLTLELRLEECHSLKEKRHWVRGLKDRLRAGHNVAVAEIADQDLHNSAVIAAVTVSASRESAHKILASAEDSAAGFLGGLLRNASVEWLA